METIAVAIIVLALFALTLFALQLGRRIVVRVFGLELVVSEPDPPRID